MTDTTDKSRHPGASLGVSPPTSESSGDGRLTSTPVLETLEQAKSVVESLIDMQEAGLFTIKEPRLVYWVYPKDGGQ